MGKWGSGLVSTAARVAVLMTCHNREILTRKCLESLKSQVTEATLDLYLVDDGSTDDTSAAVRSVWNNVNLIRGSGELWWNGGMRLAWDTAKAAQEQYDYYLWLNDDVQLEPGAVSALLADMRWAQTNLRESAIVVGATTDPITRRVNYGAQIVRNPNRPLRLSLIEPRGRIQPCDTFSGNCILISRAAEQAAGNLSADFEHIFGDLDYGLRAKKLGVMSFASSRAVGHCGTHSTASSSLDRSLPVFARIRQRLREERRVHARDWRRFARRHSGLGPLSLVYTISPYLRILFGAR